MTNSNDSRDTHWFLDRMPPKVVVDYTLRGDPVMRLLGIAADRAIVDIDNELMARPDADHAALRAALAFATAAAANLAELGNKASLSDDEKAALDLYILLVARPAIFVRDGRVAERPENWREIARDAELLPDIIAGVGRIESAARAPTGTGFLVAERRILTNNHVVCALLHLPVDAWSSSAGTYAEACDQANEAWRDEQARPRFELRGEFGSAASSVVRIRKILGHHLEVDMAILDLDANPAGSELLPLHASEPASFRGRRIYSVGYPTQASWDTPLHVLQRVFGSDPASLGTKRFSPGVVTDWDGSNTFGHDASTLAGSSGSAIVDFEDRRVVGLHFMGQYKTRNYAVPLFKFRDDPLLVSNEISFA
ncbi:MAG TPA: serine protease [Thermoanaerobaculia bacterium]|nr:serine protease [Thermoanaerobaculia bacterium]